MTDPMAFARPRGATPYVVELPMVTPDDLNAAMNYVMQQSRKFHIALLDRDESAQKLHTQTMGLAVAQYNELRDRAEPEVVTAHRKMKAQWTAA